MLFALVAPAVALSPEQKALFEQAKGFQKDNHYEEAVKIYDQLIEADKNTESLFINRALCYSNLKKYDQSLNDCESALRLHPDNPITNNNKGAALLYLNRYADAVTAFEQAIKLRPGYANAYSNKSFAECKLGKLDQAIEDADQSIKIDPNSHALTNLSMALASNGQYDKAIAACGRAITADPNTASAYNNRAATFAMMGEPAKSIDDYDKALSLVPTDLDTRNNRAASYMALQRYNDVVTDLKTALEAGGWSQPNAGTAALFCSTALMQLHQDDKAKEFANNALKKISPGSWTTGALEYLAGSKTADQFLSYSANASNSAEAEFYIGMSLLAQGNKAGALEHLEKVKQSQDKTISEVMMANSELARLKK
jgi:tetratricopeptide (TPR) repeat protein